MKHADDLTLLAVEYFRLLHAKRMNVTKNAVTRYTLVIDSRHSLQYSIHCWSTRAIEEQEQIIQMSKQLLVVNVAKCV